MSPADLKESDADDTLIWVWNSTETSWVRTSKFSAFSLFKTWPNKYVEWQEIDFIKLPLFECNA